MTEEEKQQLGKEGAAIIQLCAKANKVTMTPDIIRFSLDIMQQTLKWYERKKEEIASLPEEKTAI